jgi:hypothetical protein
MKALILFVAWCILLAISWPIALVALVVAPIVWLLALPVRLVGLCLSALFALLSTLLFVPARLLGYRRATS